MTRGGQMLATQIYTSPRNQREGGLLREGQFIVIQNSSGPVNRANALAILTGPLGLF